jgi:NMD protein affecting ribosome stability and mRNA decay
MKMKCDKCGKECTLLMNTSFGDLCGDCVNELYNSISEAKEKLDKENSKKRGYAKLAIEIKEESSPCFPDSFEEGFYDLVEDTIKDIKEYTGYTAHIELMWVDNIDNIDEEETK